MSKTAVSILGILLLLVGFAAGWSVGRNAKVPHPPPRPRTPEQVAQWIEDKGELRGILAEENVMARAAALTDWLVEAGPESVPAVATLLSVGTYGLGTPEAALLTRFWATEDPIGAADWALRHAAPIGVRPAVAEAAIEAWATQDPTAARPLMEAFVANVGGPVGETGLAAFVRGWFQSGEPGLEQFIYDQGPSAPQRRHMTILIRELLHRDGLDAVYQWLDEFPDDDPRFKRTAYRSAAPELVKADRERALAWCAEHCDRGYAAHSRALMAREWGREDGPAAMAWVSEAPAGDERDRAVRGTFLHWRETDPEGLRTWLTGMGPDGVEPWFYPVVDRVAMWRSWKSPLEAYEWAAHIPDPERRERAMISITHRYREIDAAGADAWLAQSPLSEEARAKAATLPKDYKGREQGAGPPELDRG